MRFTPQDLQSALRSRYATKQFDPTRKLTAEAWQALVDALVLAPSSFGLQPWKFLIVNDPGVREKLRAVSWNQSQVTDADRLVVIASRTDMTAADIDRWMARLSAVQGRPADQLAAYRGMIDGFANAMDATTRHHWNSRQCYIALGQLMTAAAVMGVDTCPLEGIDRAAYDEILGLGDAEYATVVACAVGYRSDADAYAQKPKARFPHGEVIAEIG